jgi:hypothetical protein
MDFHNNNGDGPHRPRTPLAVVVGAARQLPQGFGHAETAVMDWIKQETATAAAFAFRNVPHLRYN